jgi:TPP-dependent pyruvate/acetoin dehydrogenase alpha subunit
MSKTNSLPGKTELLRLYERMLILRDFELSAQAMYKKGEMPGFIHLYVGQEAVATGAGACTFTIPSTVSMEPTGSSPRVFPMPWARE